MTLEPVIHRDREEARAKLLEKVASQTRIAEAMERERHLPAALRRTFTTIEPAYLINDAIWRLRWIDCAPEGANFLLAPMQDKRGVPMGTAHSELVGPCQAVREARAARGLHPVAGPWYRVREAEEAARLLAIADEERERVAREVDAEFESPR